VSNLSTYPTPFQVVLKPGLYQSQNTKGGLNLNKWLLKFLKRIGFANTVDCCTYYPTYPQVLVANANSPTEEEMSNVPLYGVFMGFQSVNSWAIFIKTGVDSFELIVES